MSRICIVRDHHSGEVGILIETHKGDRFGSEKTYESEAAARAAVADLKLSVRGAPVVVLPGAVDKELPEYLYPKDEEEHPADEDEVEGGEKTDDDAPNFKAMKRDELDAWAEEHGVPDYPLDANKGVKVEHLVKFYTQDAEEPNE